MTTEQFIQSLKEKYKSEIANITQNKNPYDQLQYNIQLAEGVDKNTFENEIIRLIKHSQLTDTFDLWVNKHDDDFDTLASVIPVNADYSDSDGLTGMLPDAEDDYFEVSIDGKTYGVLDNNDESFTIYFNADYIGDIYPETNDEGYIIWAGKNTGRTELAQKIGQAIEKYKA